jgi:hypothetical protein
MPPEQAVERFQGLLAHLWMIRTFMKHADEVTDDEQLITIPRLLYDSIRAVEPAYLKKDYTTYLRRLKGKLGKLRRGAELLASEYSRVSAHTNFEMASLSFTATVIQMEELFGRLSQPVTPANDDDTDAVDQPN